MIVDSSAVVAILAREVDADHLANKLTGVPRPRMSAATYLELSIVMENKGGPRAGYELDELIAQTDVEIVPVTLEQAEAARVAWRRFGKGNHPARLNFGDCFSYALAKTAGEPLLFKGNDFSQTDIEPA
ncbi:MAG: type II toxin-antitoxin system VapC family toxin [Chloroflexi bacterium]|nr:type II toxin-antitoxin system VapC family toxin [Chloroflexota bacterium]